MFLENEISQLKLLLKYASVSNIAVSKKSVGWHIEHSLRVIIEICESVKQSDPDNYKKDFNLNRALIFTIGIIPRGKGRAPKSVLPKEDISLEEVNKQFEKAKKLLSEMENLSVNSNFKHPYFGMLNLKKSIKSADLHTKHHLKIIRDIVK